MKAYYQDNYTTIYHGDCRDVLASLPEQSVCCCVTSPPYFGLRDYGDASQIGLEQTPDEYVAQMVNVFRGVRRVLRDDGTLWLNLGDSYSSGCRTTTTAQTLRGDCGEDAKKATICRPPVIAGIKPKDLIGIPWRVAFALQQDGWYLRQDIIWHKPNPMPESVQDRCTKAHEYIFLMSKSQKYWYDSDAISEAAIYAGDDRGARKDNRRGTECNSMSGKTGERRNKRSVWSVNTKPYKEAHFAVFPAELITPCILAGCPEGGTVLDPFGGSGTVAEVAKYSSRKSILIELNEKYIELQMDRTSQGVLF